MTSLLKSMSTLLSNPIAATPNALAFSSPGSTQRAPSTYAPSDPKTLPPSPLSSMTSSDTHKTNKKRRYRGWICEDEISESETALLMKLEAQGRDSSSTKPTVSQEVQDSPGVTVGRFIMRERKTDGSELSRLPPNHKGPSANSIERRTNAKYNPKSQKKASVKSKKILNISKGSSSRKPRTSGGLKVDVQDASKAEDRQPPRKKPRFRGYVCEDEAEEDPALANVIRRKGKLFELKEYAPSKKSSARELIEAEEDLQGNSTPAKTQPSSFPEASSLQAHGITTASTKRKRTKEVHPRQLKARPGPMQRKLKRHKGKLPKYRAPPTNPGLLFPNLSKNSPNASPATATPLTTVPNEDSTKSTSLARAQEFVATSTSDFKHLTAIADKAAQAAAIAKRRAGDAANKLEEAKRLLRVENEKEKARKEGRRFVSGWAWVESEEDEQGWDRAGRGRRRAEQGRRMCVDQAGPATDARRVDKMAKVETGKNEDEDHEEEEEEGEEEEEEEDDDDDEDEDDDDEDEDEDDEDDNEDENGADINDRDVDDESDSGDDEDGLPMGRTADLLG